jgi:hypothetical protein
LSDVRVTRVGVEMKKQREKLAMWGWRRKSREKNLTDTTAKEVDLQKKQICKQTDLQKDIIDKLTQNYKLHTN